MDESCGSLGVCRWRGRLGHGAPEPAYQLDPGGPEHPRLRQGLRGSGARCLDFRLGRPPAAAAEEDVMEVLHPRCAGLDVHKDGVVAAVRIAAPGGGASVEVRRFETTTPGLLALGEWLAECGCTHAAMEATGVYWKPVWHVLSDGDLTPVLANAAHVKNLPGRKTDVADASWLAELLAHRLLALVHPRVKAEPARLRAALTGRVIPPPADCLGGLADSCGGRRVVGWWTMARERDHGADRRASVPRGAGSTIPGGTGCHGGAAPPSDLAAGAGADLRRGRRGAGLRAALGGRTGGALQRLRPEGARRPAAAEWPHRHAADRSGAVRLVRAGTDAARGRRAVERPQGGRLDGAASRLGAGASAARLGGAAADRLVHPGAAAATCAGGDPRGAGDL